MRESMDGAQHILVPLDGSRLAECILPLVERLALSTDADVVLLHVTERGAPARVHGDRHLTSVNEAEPYLEDVAARLRARGVRVEVHAHPAPEGNIAESIVQHSEETGATLIVLSTHGHGRVRDLLFGRIAQKVLRRGSTPVLIARPEDVAAHWAHGSHSVLVPLNGTRAAEEALLPASSLARALGASLRLVIVVPTQETLRGDRQAVGTLFPGATRASLDLEQADAETYLASLAERMCAAEPRLAVTTGVRRGDVPSALAAETVEPGTSLVILATHGRAGMQAIWTGSVAAQLLDRIHVPILLLRSVES